MVGKEAHKPIINFKNLYTLSSSIEHGVKSKQETAFLR